MINNTDAYDLSLNNLEYYSIDKYFTDELKSISYVIYNKDNIDLKNMEVGTIFDYYSDDWFYKINDCLIRKIGDAFYIINLPPGVHRFIYDKYENYYMLRVLSTNTNSYTKPNDVKSGIKFNSLYGIDLVGTMNYDEYYIGKIPHDKLDIIKKKEYIDTILSKINFEIRFFPMPVFDYKLCGMVRIDSKIYFVILDYNLNIKFMLRVYEYVYNITYHQHQHHGIIHFFTKNKHDEYIIYNILYKYDDIFIGMYRGFPNINYQTVIYQQYQI